MNRIEFMKTLGFGTAVLSSSLWSCKNETKNTMKLKNWAGNYSYQAVANIEPTDLESLKNEMIRLKKAKALGTKHCFNDIADTSGTQLMSAKFDQIIELDEKARTVLVGGGIRYGTLGAYLHEKGWALHNLASLPHISVAGSCATATHGSGVGNGNLASAIRGFELMTAAGDLLWCDTEQNADIFYSGAVSLGALGFITKVKLAIEPTYQVSQLVFENLPMSALKENFDQIMSSGYSVSLFTHWQNKNINQVWVKSKLSAADEKPMFAEFFGATPAAEHLHPIKANSPVNCTPQMGEAGPWHERLPHFKMDFTPSNGEELQSEYFVPRHSAYEAIMAVEALHEEIFPALFVTEIRAIAKDNLLMSTANGEDKIAIHFTWKPDADLVMPLLPKIEAALDPFMVVPHWGKVFTIPGSKLRERYKGYENFMAIRERLDPDGKFVNAYLEKLMA